MKGLLTAALILMPTLLTSCRADDPNTLPDSLTYPIVGTGQTKYYDNTVEIPAPEPGGAFFGQDAVYPGNSPAYRDNGDGTVTDLVTGLMWQQDPGTQKLTYEEAVAGADTFRLAGYSDWRLPTIKELYSLINFNGTDPNPMSISESGLTPFIDTTWFVFHYGDGSQGERIIDSQYATLTKYVGETTFGGGDLMFGVNFADGRIKGYPAGPMPGKPTGKLFNVMYVRGNAQYGINRFHDNGDGTVTDRATGLMWMQDDSGEGMTWEDALNYAEKEVFAGYSDWRLPDAKELQSLVDYTRSPSATGSAAIDSVFHCTPITNEDDQSDFPWYWTGTTHVGSDNQRAATAAVYVCFGRALGYMNGWQDVHGAGAQRSDPKVGDPSDFPQGRGPQGDAIRIYNFVRLVRTAGGK
jgi:hypothetical protein